MHLVVRFGLDGLRTKIRVLLAGAHQIDFPSWLARQPEELVESWSHFYQQTALPLLLRRVLATPAARTLQRIVEHERPAHRALREKFETLAELLARIERKPDVHRTLRTIFEHARVQGVVAKHWPSEEVHAQFKEAAAEVREEIKKFDKRMDFDFDAARPAAEGGLQLLEVVQPITAAYAARKRELGCLDFDDLLIQARTLLTRPGHERLRRQVASRIRLLLVDEFQDTDPLQVELVKALCDGDVAGGKLFFVGDFKQSIYRFRRADPQVFRALSEEVPPAGRLPLTENFRSQPAILDFVNGLFCEDLGEAYEPLVAHRSQVSPTPAVEFLWAPLPETPDHKPTVSEIRQREAEWLARWLRAIHDSRQPLVWDQEAGKPAARPVEFGDMALLFRALSDVQQYEEALRRYDIPYYLVGGHAFYAQQEVFDLLNLLRSINSPSDEISLAGVLRSPYFSLADESLLWLSLHPGGLAGGLFAEKPPPQLAADQLARVGFAARTLKHLRARKDRVPIAQLINETLALTGYDGVLVAEFLGERKLANLRKLIDQARQFDRSALFTLSDFITQLAEFVADQPKEALAATHPESTDVVKLLTIHMAKGLEFPLVAVPDLGRKPLQYGPAAAFHPKLGPLVKFAEGQPDRGLCGLDLYNIVESEEEEQERIRLLYVAATRAADYLLLSAGMKDLDKPESPWMNLLGRRFDLHSGACLAAVPRGSAAPQVRVTLEEPPAPATDGASQRRRSLIEVAEQAAHLAAVGDCAAVRFSGPVAADLSARRQFSFSRLHGKLHVPLTAAEAIEPVPVPPPTVQVDALELGTLVHAVLAEVPFGQSIDVAALVARHAARQLLDSATEGEALRLVTQFLRTPRAAELAAARGRHVEQEFLLAWPPGAAGAETRYLQGFIDCLYQDAAGGWHVLDYKTNQVDAASLAATAAQYEMQMLVYALAVDRILGQVPASIVLHFLRPGLEQEFKLDGKSKRALVELVNRSIDQFVRVDGVNLKQGTLF
jgi:ATP-dependent helicase/nuclease subunit A